MDNDPKVTTKEVVRLSLDVYQQLEKTLLSNIVVNKETTDTMAGYMLGIQHVLRELRNGFTIEA